METLRSSILIIVFCSLTTINVYSQDYKKLEELFSQSYTYEYKGDYNKAISVLQGGYISNMYEMNLRLGWLNYLSGLFTESMAYYEKAIKLRPYSIEAKLGYVYPAAAVGNWNIVINQYEEILKIDNQHSIANYRLGSIYYGKNDYMKAYKYFEKLVNMYPFDYDSVIMFGWTNLKMGKYKEAKLLFEKALLIRPGDKSANEGLSNIK